MGFKLTFTPENNYGLDFTMVDSKKLGKTSSVCVILTQRILKSIFLFIERFCPFFFICASVYPTIFVLCFNNKYTVFRDYYMVYLCRPGV